MATRFAVRVKPGARRALVGGRWDGRFGVALVVAVTAPAVDGRANDAVRVALAEALGVSGRDVTISVGGRSRDKVVEVSVSGSSVDLDARLRELMGDAAQG